MIVASTQCTNMVCSIHMTSMPHYHMDNDPQAFLAYSRCVSLLFSLPKTGEYYDSELACCVCWTSHIYNDLTTCDLTSYAWTSALTHTAKFLQFCGLTIYSQLVGPAVEVLGACPWLPEKNKKIIGMLSSSHFPTYCMLQA